MRLLFCGVRGSTPAPGAEFVRVGGHTSCVALAHDDQPWTLLLDAGTGIRRVTAELGGRAVRRLGRADASALGPRPGACRSSRPATATTRACACSSPNRSATRHRARSGRRAVARDEPAALPDRARRAARRLDASRRCAAGAHTVEGFDVRRVRRAAQGRPHVRAARERRRRVGRVHPRSSARGRDRTRRSHASARASTCSCTTRSSSSRERAVADLYGHATVDDALALAELAGARRLALFHHSPARADDDVEAIGRRLGGPRRRRGVDVFVAREEDVIELAATRR